jgi:hypothetical protein
MPNCIAGPFRGSSDEELIVNNWRKQLKCGSVA